MNQFACSAMNQFYCIPIHLITSFHLLFTYITILLTCLLTYLIAYILYILHLCRKPFFFMTKIVRQMQYFVRHNSTQANGETYPQSYPHTNILIIVINSITSFICYCITALLMLCDVVTSTTSYGIGWVGQTATRCRVWLLHGQTNTINFRVNGNCW